MRSRLNGILVIASGTSPNGTRLFGHRTADQLVGRRSAGQPDLGPERCGASLKTGPMRFNKGSIADLIAAEMKAGGGLITKEDLAGYRAVQRKPIHGTYRGYDIYGPPPPSSGGICLVQMLNVLENFDLKKNPRLSPETVHLLAESMRRAFCDRARHLGDPAFVKIPEHLTTKEYASKRQGH